MSCHSWVTLSEYHQQSTGPGWHNPFLTFDAFPRFVLTAFIKDGSNHTDELTCLGLV